MIESIISTKLVKVNFRMKILRFDDISLDFYLNLELFFEGFFFVNLRIS